MKKIISLLLACGMYVTTAMSQITLTPYVDSSAGGLNDSNVNVLDGFLRTLINRSGLESGYGGRFVLAVTVNLLEKSMTNTAPVKVVQKVQINFAIGDSQSGTCFGTTSMVCSGIGDTDIQAMLNSFRSIPATPELNTLIADSKYQIIAYYNQNGPAIMAKAKSLVTVQKWEEALYELSFIPRECSCYREAAKMMSDVYQAHLNHDAAAQYTTAAALAQTDPEEALAILGDIDPSSAVAAKARALTTKINARQKQLQDNRIAHERNMEKRQLEANISLENARVKACRDVAVAYAKRKTVVYNVNRWGWW